MTKSKQQNLWCAKSLMLTKIANPWNAKTNNQKALMTSCETQVCIEDACNLMKGDCGEI